MYNSVDYMVKKSQSSNEINDDDTCGKESSDSELLTRAAARRKGMLQSPFFFAPIDSMMNITEEHASLSEQRRLQTPACRREKISVSSYSAINGARSSACWEDKYPSQRTTGDKLSSLNASLTRTKESRDPARPQAENHDIGENDRSIKKKMMENSSCKTAAETARRRSSLDRRQRRNRVRDKKKTVLKQQRRTVILGGTATSAFIPISPSRQHLKFSTPSPTSSSLSSVTMKNSTSEKRKDEEMMERFNIEDKTEATTKCSNTATHAMTRRKSLLTNRMGRTTNKEHKVVLQQQQHPCWLEAGFLLLLPSSHSRLEGRTFTTSQVHHDSSPSRCHCNTPSTAMMRPLPTRVPISATSSSSSDSCKKGKLPRERFPSENEEDLIRNMELNQRAKREEAEQRISHEFSGMSAIKTAFSSFSAGGGNGDADEETTRWIEGLQFVQQKEMSLHIPLLPPHGNNDDDTFSIYSYPHHDHDQEVPLHYQTTSGGLGPVEFDSSSSSSPHLPPRLKMRPRPIHQLLFSSSLKYSQGQMEQQKTPQQKSVVVAGAQRRRREGITILHEQRRPSPLASFLTTCTTGSNNGPQLHHHQQQQETLGQQQQQLQQQDTQSSHADDEIRTNVSHGSCTTSSSSGGSVTMDSNNKH